MSAETDLPPYPMERIVAAPFPERVRLVCRSWAAQVAPNQPIVMALYWLKYLFLYLGVWAGFCALNAGYPGFGSVIEWAFSKTSFQKLMVWSTVYELIGLGCSWGPLNARFKPMTGGFRYFLRAGTTKMPLFPGVPVIGNTLRNWLDVALYIATQVLFLRILVAPEVTPALLLPPLVVLAVLGVFDTTQFLAARAEHYYVVLVCLAFGSADDLWISGTKLTWIFIWFWAATSKLNRHFPSVIMFMMNNGPFFPNSVKKRLFGSYLDDLRPSRFAARVSHMGTVIEYTIPIFLLLASTPTTTILALCWMANFHFFIMLNNPNGMPLEWNILMIYGGIFMFGFHPDASLLALGQSPWLLAFLLFSLFVVPLVGNFVPSRVSFLLSMRYYAGNWAYNIWLFRKDGSLDKLDSLKKSAGTMADQLAQLGQEPEIADLANTMTMASRFMHFEGRPLLDALPRAVDDIEDYEWIEGEVLGGSIIGWNFGDGHLNGKKLLHAIQPQCNFEPGEVRVISVESQPLFKPIMQWEIHDGATGLVDRGATDLRAMVNQQPWPTGKYAEAFEATPESSGPG
ncbi:MAG: DUF3556 domain-containing protein [Myxococcota bacterium]